MYHETFNHKIVIVEKNAPSTPQRQVIPEITSTPSPNRKRNTKISLVSTPERQITTEFVTTSTPKSQEKNKNKTTPQSNWGNKELTHCYTKIAKLEEELESTKVLGIK